MVAFLALGIEPDVCRPGSDDTDCLALDRAHLDLQPGQRQRIDLCPQRIEEAMLIRIRISVGLALSNLSLNTDDSIRKTTCDSRGPILVGVIAEMGFQSID